MYIANIDEKGFENNPHLQVVHAIAETEGAEIVIICNKLEAEIAELEDDEKMEFLQDLGMTEPGLDRVIRAGYKLLGLQTYFTAGEKEVRAWTIPIGTKAPQAAGVIHSDFEKGFIKADIYSFPELDQHATEQALREKGLIRSEGKEYVMQDGDVCHFKFNV